MSISDRFFKKYSLNTFHFLASLDCKYLLISINIKENDRQYELSCLHLVGVKVILILKLIRKTHYIYLPIKQ